MSRRWTSSCSRIKYYCTILSYTTGVDSYECDYFLYTVLLSLSCIRKTAATVSDVQHTELPANTLLFIIKCCFFITFAVTHRDNYYLLRNNITKIYMHIQCSASMVLKSVTVRKAIYEKYFAKIILAKVFCIC